MRILVTGSRDWPYPEAVWQELREAVAREGDGSPVVIVHGACPTGADQHAAQWAEGWSIHSYGEAHPADWDKHGRAAGPLRNQEMVDLGADLCLAFRLNANRSRGTTDCIDRAQVAGIPTRIIDLAIR